MYWSEAPALRGGVMLVHRGIGDRAGCRRIYAIILLYPLASAACRGRHPVSILQFLQNNWPLVLVMLVSGAMLAWPLIGSPLSTMREIGAVQATQLINRKDALILDLREAKEYEGGRLPNAMHIPLSQLASRGKELGKFTARPLIAYCGRGNRSRSAAGALTKLGFKEIYALRGGLRAWTDAGLPLEKGS
jgi:rhodanese-related sulfurtransferase